MFPALGLGNKFSSRCRTKTQQFDCSCIRYPQQTKQDQEHSLPLFPEVPDNRCCVPGTADLMWGGGSSSSALDSESCILPHLQHPPLSCWSPWTPRASQRGTVLITPPKAPLLNALLAPYPGTTWAGRGWTLLGTTSHFRFLTSTYPS